MPRENQQVRSRGREQNFDFLCNGCGTKLAIDGAEESGCVAYDCFEIWNAEVYQITKTLQDAIGNEELLQLCDVESFLKMIHERYPKYFNSRLHIEKAQDDGKEKRATKVRKLNGECLIRMAENSQEHGDAKAVIDCLLAHKDAIRNRTLVPEKTMLVKARNKIITELYSRDAAGKTTAYRAIRRCPKCGAEICGQAGMYPEIRIGVVGAPRQGKSALLTAVISAFTGNGKYGITLDRDNEDPMYKTFEKNCLNRFAANIKIRKTEETETLTYRFTANLEQEKINLLFIDIAGELLQQGKQTEFLEKYESFMRYADCFWLCTDDFQIRDLNEASAEYGLGAVRNVNGIKMDNAQLENMLSLLLDDRRSVPCAVTIVKSDTLESQDLDTFYDGVKKNEDDFFGISANRNALDEVAVNKLCNNVKKYIQEHRPPMIEVYNRYLEKCGFMACSAYGHSVADFNVAFNGDALFIYVPDTMEETLFRVGDSFDIELHEGNLITMQTERTAIAKEMRFPNCRVEQVQLRRGDDVDTSGVYGIRIPKAPDTDQIVLRMLSHQEGRPEDAHWDEGESEAPEFFVNRAVNGEDVYVVNGKEEVWYQVIDKPKPDQVEILLLWTLAMLGKFPTIGIRKGKQSLWQKLLHKEPECSSTGVLKGDEKSIAILCGKKPTFHEEC